MSSNQIPICQPFQNNHETHVPESNPQENDLRQELENKIQRLFEINCIRSFQHDTYNNFIKPKDICKTPMITAIFIFRELKKLSSFEALYQRGSKPKGYTHPSICAMCVE